MNRRRLSRLVLLFVLLLPAVTAQAVPANPFTGSAPPEPPGGSSRLQERFSGENALSLRLSRMQGELQQRMSAFIRALHGERSALVWASLLGLGTLYGVVHTLLPGHRKTVLFSYFMSEEARPVHGVLAGVSLGILHAIAAIAIVVGSYWIIESSLNVAVSRANEIVQRLSAWVIVALGLLFLIAKVRHALSHSRHRHIEQEAVESAGTSRAPLSLPAIVLSGLVPCPGSTAVLLFSLSLGIISVGVVTVTAISFGMAVTLSALSVATIVLKRGVLTREGPLGHLLHHGIEIGAAIVMLLFGIALVLA